MYNNMYDYYENVKDDVENYINENKEYFKATNLEELEEELNDQCWDCDSVTGNASGSYTFNTYKAAENLNGNWDLLQEALEEFGCSDINRLKKVLNGAMLSYAAIFYRKQYHLCLNRWKKIKIRYLKKFSLAIPMKIEKSSQRL